MVRREDDVRVAELLRVANGRDRRCDRIVDREQRAPSLSEDSRNERRRVVAQLRRPQVLFVRRVARALRRLRAAPREPKPRSRLSSDAVRARERADELAARARVAAVRDECAPAPLEARVGFAERGRDLARGLGLAPPFLRAESACGWSVLSRPSSAAAACLQRARQ